MTKTEELIAKLKEYNQFLIKYIYRIFLIKYIYRIYDESCEFATKVEREKAELFESEIATLEQELAEQKPVKSAECFVKVYIKSEKDLPKEKDEYILKFKEGYDDGDIIEGTYNKTLSENWLKSIDWYLLPVDASQFQKPLPEELEDIIDCIIKYDDTDLIWNKGRFFEVIQRDLRKLKQQTKNK